MTGDAYDLSTMRNMLGASEDGLMPGALECLLPKENNVKRLRYSGGTKNPLGDIVGQIETPFEFKALVGAVKVDSRHTEVGQFESGDMKASWLLDGVEGRVLVKGDKIIWQNVSYVAQDILIPDMDGADFFTTTLRRQV